MSYYFNVLLKISSINKRWGEKRLRRYFLQLDTTEKSTAQCKEMCLNNILSVHILCMSTG